MPLDRIPWAIIIGDRDNRLPNTTNLAFRNLRSVDLVGALDEAGICVSSGSACHSGAVEVSRVTEAMGVDFQLALGTVRFSLSRETTNDEIDRTLQVVPQAVAEVASRFECVS